jgi:hypothetical protein
MHGHWRRLEPGELAGGSDPSAQGTSFSLSFISHTTLPRLNDNISVGTTNTVPALHDTSIPIVEIMLGAHCSRELYNWTLLIVT